MISLLIGPTQTLVQNQVYAMPARNVHLFSDTALQGSNDMAFSSSIALSANTAYQVAAAFIRCTTGTAKVHLAVD